MKSLLFGYAPQKRLYPPSYTMGYFVLQTSEFLVAKLEI